MSAEFALDRKRTLVSMLLVGALFFIFGFVTWLNAILVPYLKIACELSNFYALLVTSAFYIAYTIMALPGAWLLNKTGLKKGMMIGLWIMAVGTILFIPAALTRMYPLFLAGLFIMGTGLAVLQTASNPYITVIGPEESAARRISIMGICNKAAGALAPLLLAYFILHDGDEIIQKLASISFEEKTLLLDNLAKRVINPYIVMTLVLFLLGLGIKYSPLPELDKNDEESLGDEASKHKTSIFQFPHLILGAMALFFYVGVEVIAGDTIINYGLSTGIPIKQAKMFTSFTMIFMVIGYLLGTALIPKFVKQRQALIISAVLGVFFGLGIVFSTGFTSVMFVALLGFANALIWPAIWPLAIHGLGKFINTGSALLIMAISGGAFLPPIWGTLSDAFDAQSAYWILIPFYLIILAYAVKGYKLKSWS